MDHRIRGGHRNIFQVKLAVVAALHKKFQLESIKNLYCQWFKNLRRLPTAVNVKRKNKNVKGHGRSPA